MSDDKKERVWLVYKQGLNQVESQKIMGNEKSFPWPRGEDWQILHRQLLPVDQEELPIRRLQSLYPYEKPWID